MENEKTRESGKKRIRKEREREGMKGGEREEKTEQ